MTAQYRLSFWRRVLNRLVWVQYYQQQKVPVT
jgi:hypothetical protein